jgi:hypothetical protein
VLAWSGTQYKKIEIVSSSRQYFKLHAEAENARDEGHEPLLSDSDLAELAQVLAEDVKNQQPVIYNDIVGQLLSDYRNFPAHRSAIETLIVELRAATAHELADDSRSNALGMVMHQIFNAFTLVWIVECGRGFHLARTAGLQGLELFTHAVRAGSTSIAPGTRGSLMAVGLGTGAGLTQAVYEHLRTKKLDPVEQLSGLQESMLRTHAERLVSVRRDLERGGSPGPGELDSLFTELNEIDADLGHIRKAAPHLKEVATAEMDLKYCRHALNRSGAAGGLP